MLNQGISGGRILSTLTGENALARFDRDVLSQPRVDTVILMMGINDIGMPSTALAPHAAVPSAENITSVYRQLIGRTHEKGIRVIGPTLTPFIGAFAERDTSPLLLRDQGADTPSDQSPYSTSWRIR
ncbi:hypothetical protein PSAC2689_70390 [Paraburkholderia sacchari]